MLKELFNGIESIGRSKALYDHFIDAALAAEAIDMGKLLEFMDKGVDIAVKIDIRENGFESGRMRRISIDAAFAKNV